jgi:phospholipid-binding lipoprotein MlaA
MTSKMLNILASLLLLAGLSACATAPSDMAERAELEQVNDPLEPANRAVFGFNQLINNILLKPISKAYRYVTPDLLQNMVGNVLNNAGEPVRMANALLQGRVTDSHKIFNRFLVNTTIGAGGLIDMASEGDLKPVHADFGQTLHTWGVPSGPYLILPLIGPSNPRDAIGFAVDSVAQPWGYVTKDLGGVATANRYTIASTGATLLDKSKALDQLDALEKGSLDFYAQLRSVSRQFRNGQLGVKQSMSTDYSTMDAPGKDEPRKKAKKHKKRAAAKPASVIPVVTAPSATVPDAPVAIAK